MKKPVLFFASAFVSLCASAQWVMPEVKTSDMQIGTQCYLYNAEAGAFFRGLGKSGAGPYWGTRAGVAKEGAELVKVNPAVIESISEGTGGNCVWLDADDSNTYLLQCYPVSKNRWDEVWFGLQDYVTVWVDRQNDVGGNINCFYNVTKNANGSYSFAVSPKSTTLADPDILAETEGVVINGGEKLGVNLNDLCCYLEGAEGNISYDWYFVSEEDYANIDLNAMAAYAAAMNLKNKLDDAKAEYPNADFSAAEAVYANTSSTVEELTAAITEVDKAVIEYNASQATPENPKDMTNAITNPNFDGMKYDGWLGSGFGSGGAADECAERYNTLFDTYQNIEGLPSGIYKVLVNGLYRAGSINNDWLTKDDPSQRNAKLYAVSGTDSLYTSLMSLSAGATEELINGSTTTGDNGELYVPNSMVDFVAWENAGYYQDNALFIPVENGKLKIGLRKDVGIGTDWAIVDTWRLMYYGNTAESYKYWFEDVKKTINADMIQITDDTHYYKPARQQYLDYLAKAESATTKEQYKEYGSGLTSLAAKALESIPAYDKLIAEVEKIQEELDKTSLNGLIVTFADLMNAAEDEAEAGKEAKEALKEEGVPENLLVDYSPAYLLNLTDGCFYTAEEVEAYTKKLQDLYAYCVANSLTPGDDCTAMLVNPDFSNGFTGWTNKAGNVGNFSNLEPKVPNNVEVYDNVVDCYQIINDVPDGIYSIACNAFERPAANGSYDGSEPAKVFLYMNDFQTPVQNICKDAITEDKANDGVNCYISQTYNSGAGFDLLDYQTEFGYVPNGMVGAAVAFNADRYNQKVYGIVNNGTMKIGLTSNGVKAHWVLWSNFKLTYEGVSEEAVEALAETYVANANAYIDEHADEISTPANDALATAIAAVDDAADTDAKYAAIIALNAAMTATHENAEAFKACNNAKDAMDAAVDEYGDSCSDEAIAAYNAIADEDPSEKTTAELVALTEKFNEVAAALKMPKTDDASFDNPVDMTPMIVNADFEKDHENGTADKATPIGWTLTIQEKTNLGYQHAIYTNEDVTVEHFIEGWRSGNTALGDGEIMQTIEKLPAGAYSLEADVIACNQAAGAADAEGTYLYAQEGENAWASTPVHSGNGLPEHFIVYFTKKDKNSPLAIGIATRSTTANWLAADNFKLTFYGDPNQPGYQEVGIKGAEKTKAEVVSIYNVAGQKQSKLTKGINIVKMSDDSVKKVVVK